MILVDLDRELADRVAQLVADGALPPAAARIAPGSTWRPAPDGDPASFATSLAFELAAVANRAPAEIAALLGASLTRLGWVTAAEPTGRGYLTIAVTAQALGQAAVRTADAGLAAAQSTMLAGATSVAPPWPDLAAQPDWQRAWDDQAAAMAGRLAAAAGADVTVITTTERPRSGDDVAGTQQPPVAAAVAWYGESAVRYGLARTPPGHVAKLARLLTPGSSGIDSLYPVQHAHTSAGSVHRWAADLGLPTDYPPDRLGELLCSPAERALLGLLAWLPVRVAAAARQHRPDELPSYLESVAGAWLTVRQLAPALPFGGRAAPGDPAGVGARLLLADAVQAVLAAGLALTGVPV